MIHFRENSLNYIDLIRNIFNVFQISEERIYFLENHRN
jgi:hypothetical protein